MAHEDLNDLASRYAKKYNPEGSLLRKDQKELAVILKFLADICEKNGIRWWLSSGTLLGAARHKGFIPWDDDIDIVLMREDYIRLEKILCELDSDEYVFHCMNTDVDYVYAFGKFRKREGQVRSQNRRYRYYKWKGVGLDIFAIEKTNYFAARAAKSLYNIQKLTSHISAGWIRKPLIRSIELVNFKLLHPLLRLVGKINPNEEYHYALGTGWPKHTFYEKDIYPLTKAEFEGEFMPVPKDMDTYLTNVYGDWRKFPSDESIMKSIHCQEYREEISERNKSCNI